MNPSEKTEKTLGLIGMGLVGTALAQRFMKANFHVMGYDIDPARCKELSSQGVQIANSPDTVASNVDRIVLSLPDSHIVKYVLFGEQGISADNLTDKLIADTTTGDPVITEEIAKQVQASGGVYIDACIIGSSRQVANGDVTVSLGGFADDIQRCQDIFAAFTNKVFHMGSPGKGMQAKLVANLVLGLHRLVLSEGLLFAEALNFDLPNVLEFLKSSLAYSRIMDTKGEKMITGDFQPEARMAQHLKDVNLILQMGQQAGANLPLSEIHQTLLRQGVETGKGGLDNSAIIDVLRHWNKDK